MDVLTIHELKRAASGERTEAAIHVQIDAIQKKETREQKPFYELIVADAESKMTLRAWSDAPVFTHCAGLAPGAFLEITGEFVHNGSFGLDSKRWSCRELTDAEREQLLAGPAALREKQERECDFIQATLGTVRDPRLAAICASFFQEFGPRFRRAAAARTYHHARRGGLVEHVAQMMRAAEALAGAYPRLNRDLLIAGAVLHDCGKLWENALPENGFTMGFDERGEMLGHITIGIELVNSLWRKLDLTPWADLSPSSEDVRLHLLHLIASHHGGLEFGSPVVPKTPEAWALHYIDNLDARMEMIFAGYETASALAPRVFERVRPLPGNLITPLPPFTEGDVGTPL